MILAADLFSVVQLSLHKFALKYKNISEMELIFQFFYFLLNDTLETKF